MGNAYQRHKRRWGLNGETEYEILENRAIDEFNELVDNKLNPTVHTVEYTEPFDYDIYNRFETNVVISDVTRRDTPQDVKLLHTKLSTNLACGSFVWWNGEVWLVGNEEHNSIISHRSYAIKRCATNINLRIEQGVFNFPITVTNLTLYSDGLSENVNITTSSSKYSVMIPMNDVTSNIKIDTRFLINDNAYKVTLIDDFTIKNVRTLTVVEEAINSLDDLEEDVAWNEIEEEFWSTHEIQGNDFIYLGETSIFRFETPIKWKVVDETSSIESVETTLTECKVKCKTNNRIIGNIIKVQALDVWNNVVDEIEVMIRGFF